MPTRHMVSMIAVLIAVCYAAVSQGNGPAYLPAYALLSLLLVSWLHNKANVQQIELSTHREANSFAGAVLLLPCKLRNIKPRLKFGLKLTCTLGGTASVGKLGAQEAESTISIPALKRGIYQVTSLEVSSIFPLGVFRAKSRHPVLCECYVYPEPIGEKEIPKEAGVGKPESSGAKISGDDFAGVRTYVIGESQRHIDWKAVARGQPLMVKQFESTSQSEIWLDTRSLGSLGLEAQLSQLTRWIMHCERAGIRYGVSVGSFRVAPGQGNAHYHRCLRMLAGYAGGAKK